jgi:serine/threonine protein kinase
MFPGTTPADYTYEMRLGAKTNPTSWQAFYGACSAVYLCRLRNGAHFVLKILLNVHSLDSSNLRLQFESEHSIMTRFQADPLCPPHFLDILYQTTADMPDTKLLPHWDIQVQFGKTLFVALPLLQLNVQQLISRRKVARGDSMPLLEHEEAMQIARGLLSAVRYMQLMRVVHRDMKPDNVMLTQREGRWVPVVMDFGLAVDFEREKLAGFRLPFETRHTGIGGATPFLPPEIRSAVPGPSKFLDYSKSDQFGVGLILWSMMAGAGAATTLPYQNTATGYVPIGAPRCLPEMEALICALTEPNPMERLSVTRWPRWSETEQRLLFDK